MRNNSTIYVAGHTGLIGSAVTRRLLLSGYCCVKTAAHYELDLTDKKSVDGYFDSVQPEYVVLAAGKVGGIVENINCPADFIDTNLAIQLNVLRAANRVGVKKLILFGSSCMYPRECPQPMAETALLSGNPEPTSLAYAISKLAGVQMCLAYNQQYGSQTYIPVIPNSVFGPNDNFDPKSGHVLSALIRRFHEAKESGCQSVILWGSGAPRREFIYADDVADACIALLEHDSSQLTLPLNIGVGNDIAIRDLADLVADVVGYEGEVVWDTSKPDGAPQKLLNSQRMREFGWKPNVNLVDGLRATYRWYLETLVSK